MIPSAEKRERNLQRSPAGETNPAAPLVSVIITTYNHAGYLADAVESVLAQRHARTELVIVDDGSTDHTAEVVADWPSVRYIRQENRGLPAARNTGARQSHGDFLVFLDADDLLYPEALATNLSYFARHPSCGFVSGGHDLVDADKKILEVPEWQVFPEKDHFLALLKCDYISMHGTVMYRREVFAHCCYDESLRACEDYDFYLQVAARYPVCSHGEKLAAYRRHEDSMSSDKRLMYHSAMKVLDKYDKPSWGARVRAACAAGRKDLRGHYLGQTGLRPSLGERVKNRLWRPGPRGQVPRRVPLPGRVRMGDLRRTTPFSPDFGYDRGGPVDREYIEGFLAENTLAIRGHVLEIGDNTYSRRYGGDKVTRSDVLHVVPGHPGATLSGDLSHADHIPSAAFDCIILTQTLHLIYDFRAALAHCHRILKPGGMLLMTVPGISQTDYGEWGASWYWSFTPAAVSKMLAAHFEKELVTVRSHGNVRAAAAFLYGMGAAELTRAEKEETDTCYPLITTAAAVKTPET